MSRLISLGLHTQLVASAQLFNSIDASIKKIEAQAQAPLNLADMTDKELQAARSEAIKRKAELEELQQARQALSNARGASGKVFSAYHPNAPVIDVEYELVDKIRKIRWGIISLDASAPLYAFSSQKIVEHTLDLVSWLASVGSVAGNNISEPSNFGSLTLEDRVAVANHILQRMGISDHIQFIANPTSPVRNNATYHGRNCCILVNQDQAFQQITTSMRAGYSGEGPTREENEKLAQELLQFQDEAICQVNPKLAGYKKKPFDTLETQLSHVGTLLQKYKAESDLER